MSRALAAPTRRVTPSSAIQPPGVTQARVGALTVGPGRHPRDGRGGRSKAPIADQAFTAAGLSTHRARRKEPIQEDLKKAIVPGRARADSSRGDERANDDAQPRRCKAPGAPPRFLLDLDAGGLRFGRAQGGGRPGPGRVQARRAGKRPSRPGALRPAGAWPSTSLVHILRKAGGIQAAGPCGRASNVGERRPGRPEADSERSSALRGRGWGPADKRVARAHFASRGREEKYVGLAHSRPPGLTSTRPSRSLIRAIGEAETFGSTSRMGRRMGPLELHALVA